jgi:hypothetical protein
MHENMHQLISGLNAVAFNISNKGRGVGRFTGRGNYSGGYGGRSCGHGHPSPRGRSFPPTGTYGEFPSPGGFAGGCFPGLPPGTQPPPTGIPQGRGLQPYRAPGLPGMLTPGLGPAPFAQSHLQQQPFSNTVKCHANWKVCYLCGFDVADGHTSMSCPAHL